MVVKGKIRDLQGLIDFALDKMCLEQRLLDRMDFTGPFNLCISGDEFIARVDLFMRSEVFKGLLEFVEDEVEVSDIINLTPPLSTKLVEEVCKHIVSKAYLNRIHKMCSRVNELSLGGSENVKLYLGVRIGKERLTELIKILEEIENEAAVYAVALGLKP